MWTAMDGYKRWMGLALAVVGLAICLLEAWPVSTVDIATCLRRLVSPETLAGMGIGVGAVGAVHAVEKNKTKKGAS